MLKNNTDHLTKGVAEIIPIDQFNEQLSSNRPLKLKFGADPSRPDIHLGHVVLLKILRRFQDAGHGVQFIIGDFTAKIGDPTGKNKTRPALTDAEILANATSYQDQVFKILDRQKTTVYYNSEWLNTVKPNQFISLLSQVTIQQLLARDDFSKRHSQQVPIYLHECIYPILQAYDSVHLESDIEFGGTDQKFNLLLGREFQRVARLSPQSIVLMPILEGLDGIQKMSKSLDNYIGINEEPKEIFGKLMSISDDLMVRYFEILSDQVFNTDEHPMTAKKNLAQEITGLLTTSKEAQVARQAFEKQFSDRAIPTDIPQVTIKRLPSNKINLVDGIVQSNVISSKNEVRRLLKQSAIKMNGKKQCDELVSIENEFVILQIGKRKFVRFNVEN